MKKIMIFMSALCCSVISCTMEKTDYRVEIDRIVPEHTEFGDAAQIEYAGYRIIIQTLNGTLYKGYNEIRLQITNSVTGQKEEVSSATFLPIRTISNGSASSCPHRYKLTYRSEESLFKGYVVFTSGSSVNDNWEIYLSFTVGNRVHKLRHPITVKEQPNKNLNMTTFTGSDNQQYFIALVSPQKPKVAENRLIAGIYQYNRPVSGPIGAFPDPSQFSYSEVSGYTLKLDPRMPEPSMGNHSSPNNIDLTGGEDGLYHGVVNYTMTGNWTLNLIMLNQNGRILKGTIVPTDFTPGVEGVKSELRIDILF